MERRGSRPSFSYSAAVESTGHALSGLAGFALLPLFHTQLFFFLLESMSGNASVLCLGWVLVPSLVTRVPRLRGFTERHLRVFEPIAGSLLTGSLAAGAAGFLTIRLALSAAGLSVFWGCCQVPQWGGAGGADAMGGLITGNHLALILHLWAGMHPPPSPDLRFLRSLPLLALLLLGVWAVPPCRGYRRRRLSGNSSAWRYLRVVDHGDGDEEGESWKGRRHEFELLQQQQQHRQLRQGGRADTTGGNSSTTPASFGEQEAAESTTTTTTTATLPPFIASPMPSRWLENESSASTGLGSSRPDSPPSHGVGGLVASAGFGGLMFLTALLAGSPWTGDDWAPSPGLGAGLSALRQASVVFAWGFGRALATRLSPAAATLAPATATAAAAAAVTADSASAPSRSSARASERSEHAGREEGRVHYHHRHSSHYRHHDTPDGLAGVSTAAVEQDSLILAPSPASLYSIAPAADAESTSAAATSATSATAAAAAAAAAAGGVAAAAVGREGRGGLFAGRVDPLDSGSGGGRTPQRVFTVGDEALGGGGCLRHGRASADANIQEGARSATALSPSSSSSSSSSSPSAAEAAEAAEAAGATTAVSSPLGTAARGGGERGSERKWCFYARTQGSIGAAFPVALMVGVSAIALFPDRPLAVVMGILAVALVLPSLWSHLETCCRGSGNDGAAVYILLTVWETALVAFEYAPPLQPLRGTRAALLLVAGMLAACPSVLSSAARLLCNGGQRGVVRRILRSCCCRGGLAAGDIDSDLHGGLGGGGGGGGRGGCGGRVRDPGGGGERLRCSNEVRTGRSRSCLRGYCGANNGKRDCLERPSPPPPTGAAPAVAALVTAAIALGLAVGAPSTLGEGAGGGFGPGCGSSVRGALDGRGGGAPGDGSMAAAGSPDGGTLSERLRVVNFNMYMGYDRRGEDNAFRVAELLQRLDADVAALQETGLMRVTLGNRHPTGSVARAAGMVLAAAAPVSEDTWGCAILSRLPVLSWGWARLPRGPGENACEAHATLSLGPGKGTATVVNVHLGNEGDTDTQVTGILSLLQDLQEQHSHRFWGDERRRLLIVVGDFNFDSESSEYKRLVSEAGLVSAANASSFTGNESDVLDDSVAPYRFFPEDVDDASYVKISQTPPANAKADATTASATGIDSIPPSSNRSAPAIPVSFSTPSHDVRHAAPRRTRFSSQRGRGRDIADGGGSRGSSDNLGKNNRDGNEANEPSDDNDDNDDSDDDDDDDDHVTQPGFVVGHDSGSRGGGGGGGGGTGRGHGSYEEGIHYSFDASSTRGGGVLGLVYSAAHSGETEDDTEARQEDGDDDARDGGDDDDDGGGGLEGRRGTRGHGRVDDADGVVVADDDNGGTENSPLDFVFFSALDNEVSLTKYEVHREFPQERYADGYPSVAEFDVSCPGKTSEHPVPAMT